MNKQRGFALLPFVASPLGKWAIIGILLIVAFGAGWVKGNDRGFQKLIDYQQKQAEEAVRIGKVRTEVTERVVTRYLEKKAATERIIETIEKEVKVYADANQNMCIDATWLRLHDSAAINAGPKPPPVPSSILRTTATDYWHPYGGAGLTYSYPELRPPSSVR